MKSLATLAGSFDAKNICDLLQASQDSQKLGASAGTSLVPNGLIPNGLPVQASTKESPSTPKMAHATSTHGPPLRQVNDSVCVAVAAADIPSGKQLTEASLGQYALEVSSSSRLVIGDLILVKAVVLYLLFTNYLQILQRRGLG